MSEEELSPMDMLSQISQDLLAKFHAAKNQQDRTQLMEKYLEQFQTDVSLESLKSFRIEFRHDLDWFNIDQPLSMERLRGKFVILDFFTYCCINCVHVLDELRALEDKFSVESGLVVIGVHSPKFDEERDSANIGAAAERLSIAHAVVNDEYSSMWRELGIRCWPTLLLVSPSGMPLLMVMGEGHGVFLQQFLEHCLRLSELSKEVIPFSLNLRTSTGSAAASHLRFPSKIARSASGLFALADSGNNRILVFELNGMVLHKIGGLTAGFADGDLLQARFNSPQGVTFFGEDVLIVADTGNHALRKVSLAQQKVTTIVGNGKQGSDRVGGKVGTNQSLSSPWDVAVFQTRDMDMSFHADEQSVTEKFLILISMAGTHQIWCYFPEGIVWWKFREFEPCTCVALIGNGLEENRNNSYPQNASFAQPSGIALTKNFLFIADSESSSIRKVAMMDGKVTGVVGGERNPLNLFAFGDADGKQCNAKLQHPLAVCFNEKYSKVYVADTYNHKIKVIDPATDIIKTLAIKCKSGELYRFKQPAGLCCDLSGDQLLVSDTNNHILKIVNLQTLEAKTFELKFLRTLPATETDSAKPSKPDPMRLKHLLPLENCKELQLLVLLKFESGLKLTPNAPQKWSLNTASFFSPSQEKSGYLAGNTIELHLLRNHCRKSIAEIQLNIALNLCNASVCLTRNFTITFADATDTNAKNPILRENLVLRLTQSDVVIER